MLKLALEPDVTCYCNMFSLLVNTRTDNELARY